MNIVAVAAMTLNLLLIGITFQQSKGEMRNNSNICENDDISIRCNRGIIWLKGSVKSPRPTYTLYSGNRSQNCPAICASDFAFQSLTNRCDNRSSCMIPSKGDDNEPCKYFVDFECVTKCGFNDGCMRETEVCIDEENRVRCDCATSYYRNSKGVCIPDECKDDTLSIRCEDGLIDIRGSHDNLRGVHTVYCGGSSIQNYSAPCLSYQEIQSLRQKCNDKPSCEIPGRAGLDGICVDYLNFACVFKCGLNDHCNATTEICSEINDRVECECAERYIENKDGVCTEKMETCQEDMIYYNGIMLSFPETKKGTTVNSNEMCPLMSSYPNSSIASRDCTGTKWSKPMVKKCYDDITFSHQLDVLTKINVTENNVQTVAKTLAITSSQENFKTQKELESVITSLSSVVQVQNPTQEVTNSVVGVVNNVMNMQKIVEDDAREMNLVVALLEDQVACVLKSGQNYTSVSSNLEVGAVQVERTSLEKDYTFEFTHLEDPYTLQNSSFNNTNSSITLPNSVLNLVDRVYPNASLVPISFMAFKDDGLFKTQIVTTEQMPSSFSDEYIEGHVLAVKLEVNNVIIKDLPNSSDTVVTRFPVSMESDIPNKTQGNVEYACVKWESTNGGRTRRWSREGCSTKSSSGREIVCSCNQLSSFAVLVKIRYGNDMTERSLTITFHVITKVGSFFSVFCLAVTIIAILLKRSIRTKQQTKVHINLCVALLAFYMTFLTGIDQSNDCLRCKVSSTLIHFFCLSAMAWMSVEACIFYNFFWKLRRTVSKNLLPFSMTVAWGVPFVISMSCVGLDSYCYNDYCFLHGRYLIIFGFLLEMLVMFLFNFTIFMLVTYRLTCRRIFVVHQLFTEMYLRLKRIYGFWLLLGLSWIFGFLSAIGGPMNDVLQMIFTLFMTLQGVGIFIVLVLNNPEIRKKFESITYSRKSKLPSEALNASTHSTY